MSAIELLLDKTYLNVRELLPECQVRLRFSDFEEKPKNEGNIDIGMIIK